MPRERLVVIGGNAAGMSAASQARRRRPDLEIIAFEKGSYASYALDLGYSPPFSGVWDPVQIAARQALKMLDGGPG